MWPVVNDSAVSVGTEVPISSPVPLCLSVIEKTLPCLLSPWSVMQYKILIDLVPEGYVLTVC